MNAPIRAAMIGGIDNTPNTITPRGNRLPGPGEMSIQTNCPTIGRTPHLHERLGSKNANVIETKQTAGIPREKYKLESHASLRPDTCAIRIQIAAPQPAAKRYNQCCLFIQYSLVDSSRVNSCCIVASVLACFQFSKPLAKCTLFLPPTSLISNDRRYNPGLLIWSAH